MCGYSTYMYKYLRSLAKEGQLAEHLTSLPNRGVGTLLSVSAFKNEKAPMSGLPTIHFLQYPCFQ